MLVALLLAMLSGLAAQDGAAQPTLTQPLPDIEIYAGSTIDRAADLSDHFTFQDLSAASFSAEEVVSGAPAVSDHIILTFQNHSLTVQAPSTSWTGNGTFRVRACEAGSCLDSNSFGVQVFPPPYGRTDLNPPGYDIESGSGSFRVDPGSRVEFSLVGLPITNGSGPDWYLDGNLMGTGHSVSFDAPTAPGNYEVQAQFVSDGQHKTVVRNFEVVTPPRVQLWAWGGGVTGTVLAFLAAAAVAMLVCSARLRRPFVLAFIGGIYPRLQPVSLLDHFSRGTLFQAIKETPGIHFSELTRKTSMSRGRAAHHLRVMERAGLVRCEFVGAYTRYFTDSDPPQEDDYGLSPTEREVLRAVVERPGIFQTELAAAVARSAGTVSRAVKHLAGYGYVTPRREERQRRVYPGPREIPAALLGSAPTEAPPAAPLNTP